MSDTRCAWPTCVREKMERRDALVRAYLAALDAYVSAAVEHKRAYDAWLANPYGDESDAVVAFRAVSAAVNARDEALAALRKEMET